MNTNTLNKVASNYTTWGLSALDEPIVNRGLSIVGRLAILYLFGMAVMFHLTFGFDMTIKNMTAHGIPFPKFMNVVAMVISGGLALALLFDFKTRWAALGLALYVLCVSTVMYGPLNDDWEKTRVLFMKDMAIFGALLAWSCALSTQARQR